MQSDERDCAENPLTWPDKLGLRWLAISGHARSSR
jgi:hypothetical protein